MYKIVDGISVWGEADERTIMILSGANNENR